MVHGKEKSDGDQREILFEFRPVGPQIRVAAIDAETGTEVIVIAPIGASQLDMQRVAIAKLKRKLAKDAM
ncbi:hypothetical protein MNBD_ALPHA12-210 [hydrothermal vent metagenome]|uniref:DUF6898 domain-containing protein n=1 Tax=hydrothermal vent metagenome TaxID=652676 RepID=A0A3B0TZS5_9ZZZZ